MTRTSTVAHFALALSFLIPPRLLGAPQPAAPLAPDRQAVVSYAPDDSDFFNPERGFYHQVDCSSGPLRPAQLQQYRTAQRDSLVLCVFLLSEAVEAEIAPARLELLQRQFSLVREAGLKMVLRFAYNNSDNGVDAPPELALRHLDQLRPVLRRNSDVLAVMQAGFIGSWGEWANTINYGNGNLSAENWRDRKLLLDKILDVLPRDRMVQLRTPELKYRLTGPSPMSASDGRLSSVSARVGHHNDCFLASDSDYGTYQLMSPASPAWLEADSAYVPVGGETCAPNPPRSECRSALAELARFHWSYLNADFHQKVLDSWKEGGCEPVIRRRLGYRLALRQGVYERRASPGGQLKILVMLENTGFAAPYNPRPVELVLRNESGKTLRIRLDAAPRAWLPGRTIVLRETVTVPADIPAGDYSLLLHMPDPEPTLRQRPEYAIRFANAGVWEAGTGFNRLDFSVRIDGQ
jgi:hypothetical protein